MCHENFGATHIVCNLYNLRGKEDSRVGPHKVTSLRADIILSSKDINDSSDEILHKCNMERSESLGERQHNSENSTQVSFLDCHKAVLASQFSPVFISHGFAT